MGFLDQLEELLESEGSVGSQEPDSASNFDADMSDTQGNLELQSNKKPKVEKETSNSSVIKNWRSHIIYCHKVG